MQNIKYKKNNIKNIGISFCLYFYLNIKFFLIYYNSYISFCLRFWFVLFFKLLLSNLDYLWYIELFSKTKTIKTKNFFLNIFIKSFKNRWSRFSFFKKFLKSSGIFENFFFFYIHYFKFLYKFKFFRELSFSGQYVFKKLYKLSVYDMLYLSIKNNFSWDPTLRAFYTLYYFKSIKHQLINLKKYICIYKRDFLEKKIDIFVFIKNFISLSSFFFCRFSFGDYNRLGRDNFINFILFLRRSYLNKYGAIKDLSWVHIKSKKKLIINYIFDYLNFFCIETTNLYYINVYLFFFNSEIFKKYLNFFYITGLSDIKSKINFNLWFNNLTYLFISYNLIIPNNNNYNNYFIFSIFYISFYYISYRYAFFNFIYKIFGDLSNIFNFKGLPNLKNIKFMSYNLLPKKKYLMVKKGIWFKETNFILKKKYKNLRVWKLWKFYNHLIKYRKELSLKLFLKFNNVFFKYYSLFFLKKNKLLKKKIKILKNFKVIECRIDILLYRLGFMHDLYYLRKYIKLGYFLFNKLKIMFIAFFVLIKSLVHTSIQCCILFYKQFFFFRLGLKKNRQFNIRWFNSGLNYLRYVEFNYKKFAFILIRTPRFGELSYINEFKKFSKKRYPLFEKIKKKHYIFSRIHYSRFLSFF